MAAVEGVSFAALASRIDRERDTTVPLASALRVAAVDFLSRRAARALANGAR